MLNLSYLDKDANLQSCALWFASDAEVNLYYLTSLSTLHGSSLQNGGTVAFTINKDDQHWKEIQGIQGRGNVEIISDESSWATYTEKFPFVKDQFSNLKDALDKTKLWKLTPSWLRLIDNTKGFGHKEELNL